jgi:Dehydrogenases with different specificities (related to short-chain alcohol dehydrogenases)
MVETAESAGTLGMAGKVCLITGGSGGIGFVAARELVRMGAAVTIVGRDRRRGEAAADAIRAAAVGGQIRFLAADLSDQSQVHALATRVLADTPRLDVLVNNAGGLFGKRRLSVDGLEMTFALNHLNYFLLSHLLLPALQAAAPARIVNVASAAHKGVTLDFDDLQGEERYDRWLAYKRSKLANIMFTYEMARRIDGRGISVNALHPGFVATDIGVRHGFVPGFLWWIGKLSAISPEEGAKTTIYLASSPDVADASGQYFSRCKPKQSSDASYDHAASERLWDVSVNLSRLDTGLYYPL